MPTLPFTDWIAEVDALMWKHVGCSIHDFPDQPLYDEWLAGCEPEDFVLELVEEYAR